MRCCGGAISSSTVDVDLRVTHLVDIAKHVAIRTAAVASFAVHTAEEVLTDVRVRVGAASCLVSTRYWEICGRTSHLTTKIIQFIHFLNMIKFFNVNPIIHLQH